MWHHQFHQTVKSEKQWIDYYREKLQLPYYKVLAHITELKRERILTREYNHEI